MNKMFKKIISAMLAVAVGFSCVTAGFFSIEASAGHINRVSGYKTGDKIEFGSYPQSKVTDEALIDELNLQDLNWVSYGYYSGDENNADSIVQGDWMKYADVTYHGNKYRAVTFSKYRPMDIFTAESSVYGNWQSRHGYYTDTAYWFKYEPLVWRVLDAEDGFVMCENVIDSQAYCNVIYPKEIESVYEGDTYFEWYNDPCYKTYASDYATSSIREWLNDDFYNTAFTSSEKAEIEITTLDNSCYENLSSRYDSETTYDKIFLLSYDEVKNTNYGFPGDKADSKAREASGTDYAECQGLRFDTPEWTLRTPFGASCVCYIDRGGCICYTSDYQVNYTCFGIRPALKFIQGTTLRLSNSELMFEDDGMKISANEGADKICVYPTAMNGEKVTIETAGTPIKVSSSGTYYLKYDAWHEAGCDVKTTMKIGDEEYTVSFVFTTVTHSYGEWEITALPTCTETGLQSKVCSICGNVETEDIPPTFKHTQGEWTVAKAATWFENGQEEIRCTVCNQVIKTRVISATRKALLGYSVGDIIEFGSYPCSKVTDVDLLEELNKLELSWKEDNSMCETDVIYDGTKYRALKKQSDTINVYWFKYEPIKWRVLSPGSGYVMSENLIDARAFDSKYCTNDFEDSEICEWLNGDFYNVAFDNNEKTQIKEVSGFHKIELLSFRDITNRSYGFLDNDGQAETPDKAREALPTAYASFRGGAASWWLKSPSRILWDEYNQYVMYVAGDGSFCYYPCDDPDFMYEYGWDGCAYYEEIASKAGMGVRPAMRISFIEHDDIRLLDSKAYVFDKEVKIYGVEDAEKICVYPTAKSGEKVTIETAGTPIKVSSSGTYYLKYDAWHEAGCDVKTTMKIGDEEYTVSFVFTTVNHTEVDSPAVAPTCTETGLTAGTHCEICKNPIEKQQEIPALGHSYGEWETTTVPTCTEIGVDSKICSVCGDVATKEIPALGHNEGEWTVVKPATKLERGEEELRCTVCTEILETREIPSISETLVSDEELMAIRGVAETKAYKDEDYIALVKRSGATSVGVYKETIDGYSVEITMQYGKINDTGTYYVAYESQNKTNPAGIMKVTYPDGTVKQSRVVFELYDIDMEVDINPAESVKPIRGKVSLQNDVAGDYILVQMSEGQTSVGMYKKSLDETVLTLIETSGVVQEKDNWFISYGSQNTKNPEGRLHVVKSDGREATYRIVFRLFETDPDASPLRSLKAIRGTVTVENDGTEDYIRVKRSAGKTSVGLYKNTTAGIEYEITDSTGILQDKSSMYIAYRSQNEEDITGKINFKMPDGTIQSYKIIFSF